MMRHLDDLKTHPGVDQRMVAIAVTKLQEASMWGARAVFQPKRASEADLEAADAAIASLL